MANQPEWDTSKLSFGPISAEAITVFCYKCRKYCPCDCNRLVPPDLGAEQMTAGCVTCGSGDCEHLRRAKGAR